MGGALLAAGWLMLWCPALKPIPPSWLVVGGFWLLGSLSAFLPAGYFPSPEWRAPLTDAGLDAGWHFTLQPGAAMGSLAVMVVTGVVALWTASQRVNLEKHPCLGAFFVALICIYGLIAWLAPGFLNIKTNASGTFGFFPNRNHTASLLNMGALVSLGLIVQGIRWRRIWMTAGGSLALLFLLCLLFGLNISRAGILLLALGLILWVCLTGPRYLSGHVGKAVAIVSGGALLYFLQLDTTVKHRLKETIERVAPGEASDVTGVPKSQIKSLDGRVAIHRDAAAMIAEAPLTGWGAGQFQFVFPQYRHHTSDRNHAVCLHPESDWWWMAAETGIPATASLAALLAAMVIPAIRAVRRGRARGLRASFLVAALVLPIHGLIDVPGHHFSLLWFSAGLLALASGTSDDVPLRKARVAGWRLPGGAVAIFGALLVHGEWIGMPLPAADRSSLHVREALELYHADLSASATQNPADAEAMDRGPEPDPLEVALGKLDEAVALMPMNSQAQGLRGVLALHFTDREALARKSFANQRLLDPMSVDLPLAQANAWSRISQDETRDLWLEAMRRADHLEKFLPETHWRGATYGSILNSVKASPSLYAAAIEAAGGDSDLLKMAGDPHPIKRAKLAR